MKTTRVTFLRGIFSCWTSRRCCILGLRECPYTGVMSSRNCIRFDWEEDRFYWAHRRMPIRGNRAAPRMMKLVRVEVQRKIDENDTSDFDVDTFVQENRISARCRKALHEAFFVETIQRRQKTFPSASSRPLRSLPLERKKRVSSSWRVHMQFLQESGSNNGDPPALRGPWVPLHPDYDRSHLY